MIGFPYNSIQYAEDTCLWPVDEVEDDGVLVLLLVIVFRSSCDCSAVTFLRLLAIENSTKLVQ